MQRPHHQPSAAATPVRYRGSLVPTGAATVMLHAVLIDHDTRSSCDLGAIPTDDPSAVVPPLR
jgi:hypothetical protein